MYYDCIGEISRRIREQTVSPVEAVETCLKRIETLNPTRNAFITVMDGRNTPGTGVRIYAN